MQYRLKKLKGCKTVKRRSERNREEGVIEIILQYRIKSENICMCEQEVNYKRK